MFISGGLLIPPRFGSFDHTFLMLSQNSPLVVYQRKKYIFRWVLVSSHLECPLTRPKSLDKRLSCLVDENKALGDLLDRKFEVIVSDVV
jgi:hypothetical protein